MKYQVEIISKTVYEVDSKDWEGSSFFEKKPSLTDLAIKIAEIEIKDLSTSGIESARVDVRDKDTGIPYCSRSWPEDGASYPRTEGDDNHAS